MQLQDFEEQPRGDCWKSREPVSTALGGMFVELWLDDRKGRPDEAMLELANELARFAQTRGELILDVIYDHYRNAEESGHVEFWDVPSGLNREQVISEVESVTLCVSRYRHVKRPYDAYIHVAPNWEQEHNLFLRYTNGQLAEFDPMGGE